MTVQALHKALGKLIEQGKGRHSVCVDKGSFRHPLECDGDMILSACGIRAEWVPTADDDGGTKVNKDGTESGSRCAVIYGHSYEKPKDQQP